MATSRSTRSMRSTSAQDASTIARERDLPEVDLFLEDEVEQQVERPLEDRACGPRTASDVEATGAARRLGDPRTIAASVRGTPADAGSVRRHGARVLGDPAHRRDAPRQLPRRGAALGRRPATRPTPDQSLFCVVDLHAMTLPYDPAELTADDPPHWRCCCSPPGLDPSAARCSCRATCPRTPSSPGSSTASPPSASCAA